MKWYSYLICAVCILLGIFASLNLVKMWKVNSGVYGTFTYESIETKNNYTEIAKFDYGAIPFETADYVNYNSISTFGPEKIDGSKQNLVVLFNDNICSDITLYSGKITGSFSLNFYGTDGNLACTATINMLMEFNEDKTTITLTMKNQDSSIAYLNRYMSVHGASIKIVERG